MEQMELKKSIDLVMILNHFEEWIGSNLAKISYHYSTEDIVAKIMTFSMHLLKKGQLLTWIDTFLYINNCRNNYPKIKNRPDDIGTATA